MKHAEEIMEILSYYDLTRSLNGAAALAGCSPHTVARYVAARDAGELVVGAPVRRTRLIDVAGHDLVDGLARGLGNRRPEILRRRVAVGVRLQVFVHAFAESLRPQVSLQHAQDCRGFVVRDAIK